MSAFALPSDIPSRLSLLTGLALFGIGALFTLGMLAAVLTGNAALVESSRLINRSYAALSVCGEALAFAGLVAGASAWLRKRQLGPALLFALVVNLAGLIMFLPASLALLLTVIVSLLERLT